MLWREEILENRAKQSVMFMDPKVGILGNCERGGSTFRVRRKVVRW